MTVALSGAAEPPPPAEENEQLADVLIGHATETVDMVVIGQLVGSGAKRKTTSPTSITRRTVALVRSASRHRS